MSIQSRLLLALAVLVGALIGVSAFDLWTSREHDRHLAGIKHHTHDVTAELLPVQLLTQSMQVAVVEVQQVLNDAALTHNPKSFDEAKEYAAQFDRDIIAARQKVERSPLAAAGGPLAGVALRLAAMEGLFKTYAAAGVRMANVYIAEGREAGDAAMEAFDPLADKLLAEMAGVRDTVAAAILTETTSMTAAVTAAEALSDLSGRVTVALIVVGLVLAGIAFAVVRWGVAVPLHHLIDGIRGLADGNLDITVIGKQRHDEFGGLARALQQFLDQAIENRRLAAEREMLSRQAEEAKAAALKGMATTIETDTAAVVEALSGQVSKLLSISSGMAELAGQTGANAAAATEAAQSGLATVESVASAAEELAASLRSTAANARRSTDTVRAAVTAGNEARGTIADLSERVSQIGNVAEMISEIASRTNLLALNATIEAARAGDAGKGFAVVASEVKALANQTARSTEEIARHIGEVRAATQRTVGTVEKIEKMIAEVETIAGAIAEAVEQQDQATSEIARNITETAAAAQVTSARISDLATAADRTDRDAKDVSTGADLLAQSIEGLKTAVVRIVRTSTTDVERRLERRITTEVSGRVIIGSEQTNVQIRNISGGGAMIEGDLAALQGSQGTLRLADISFPLPVTLLGNGGGPNLYRIGFQLDDATRAALNAALVRLDRRAA